MLNTLALAGALAFIVITARVASTAPAAGTGSRWLVPASLSVLFLVYSTIATQTEGIGFWVEHTRNLWGVQIWFDLLLAAGVAWALIAPRARAVGMRLWPWLAGVALTGSIGLCAMLARLWWLEARARS